MANIATILNGFVLLVNAFVNLCDLP